jgi:hypothetical protein
LAVEVVNVVTELDDADEVGVVGADDDVEL